MRKYSGDAIGDMKSGNIWVGHDWGGDIWTVQETTRPSMTFVLPEEGGVAAPTRRSFCRAPRIRSRPTCSSTTCSTPKVSAANTNTVYYMGPNAAAKEFIVPAILEDPSLNPDQAILDNLQELLDLGPTWTKYASRYQELRSGG